jgi:hypothetical protein
MWQCQEVVCSTLAGDLTSQVFLKALRWLQSGGNDVSALWKTSLLHERCTVWYFPHRLHSVVSARNSLESAILPSFLTQRLQLGNNEATARA